MTRQREARGETDRRRWRPFDDARPARSYRRQPRRRPVVGGARRLESTVRVPSWLARAKEARRAGLTLQMPRIRISLDRARVVGAALFCLCALGLYTLGNDDRFYVQQVVVEGNAILPQAEVERAAGITYWNLFFIDPRSVEAALLRVPEVKYAAVTVELPSQVTIQVLERKPVLIWQTGDKQFWVDGEGLALVERRRVNLPILVDADRRPAGPGEMVAREAVEAAVALLQAWPEGPRVMEWSAARGLAVVAEQGWKVYIGNARQMPEKVAALRVTAQAISRSGLKPAFVDLGNGLPYFQERR